MQPAVAVSSLSKNFGEVTAVDDLTFEVAPGHICGLLGPNGAGKTTTVRILLGLVYPSAGEARVLGRKIVAGDPVLERVGVLVEQPAFIPHLSGRRNLEFFWRQGGGRWPAPGLDRALGIAGLGPDIDRRVKTYSQGMHQRLGVAQALLGSPEVLVLDEPTNGLDPGETRAVRAFLKSLATDGITVLLSSHLLAEVEQICSHVVVMDRGRLVTEGTVESIIGAETGVYIEVDEPQRARTVLEGLGLAARSEPPGLTVELNGLARTDLVAALVRAGVGVMTVMTRNRLEDAFLGLLEGRR
jgi:ABC-2 type transport system ATP-binding protein